MWLVRPAHPSTGQSVGKEVSSSGRSRSSRCLAHSPGHIVHLVRSGKCLCTLVAAYLVELVATEATVVGVAEREVEEAAAAKEVEAKAAENMCRTSGKSHMARGVWECSLDKHSMRAHLVSKRSTCC